MLHFLLSFKSGARNTVLAMDFITSPIKFLTKPGLSRTWTQVKDRTIFFPQAGP